MRPDPDNPAWPSWFRQQGTQCADPALRRFYDAGLPAPDTPLSQLRLMAVDFETTGMDPARHAIVSIGVVPFDLHRIRPAAGRYWVVRPSSELEPTSVALHRITDQQVREAPPLSQVLDDVLRTLAGHVAVVHYRHIERPFLDAACRRDKRGHCLFPVIDTMDIEARHARTGPWQPLRRLFGLRPASVRLAASRERYGLPPYTAHHAKLDALATAELFVAQVARHYPPDTPLERLWV